MADLFKKKRTFMILMIVFGNLMLLSIFIASMLTLSINNSERELESKAQPPVKNPMSLGVEISDIVYLGVYGEDYYSLAKVYECIGGESLDDYILLRSSKGEPNIYDEVMVEGMLPRITVYNDDVYWRKMDISTWIDAEVIEDNPEFFAEIDEYTFQLVDMDKDVYIYDSSSAYMDPQLGGGAIVLGKLAAIAAGKVFRIIAGFFGVISGIAFTVFLILFIVFSGKVRRCQA